MRKTFGLTGPRGLVGKIQGGVSTANLGEALFTKGLSSANVAQALSNAPAATTPASQGAADNAPSAPSNSSPAQSKS